MANDWSPGAWRAFEARQQPDYPDPDALSEVLGDLVRRPALVPFAEVEALTGALAEAQAGRAFVLQAGDCAESLGGPSAQDIRNGVALIEAVAALLVDAAGLPVVRIARMAGQFAKPRSRDAETRAGVSLPMFRGEIVNGSAFEASARTADAARMPRAYDHASATLAELRAVATPSPVYTGHEALLLPWEEALTRPAGDSWYGSSGHFLWVGHRTRFAGSAHIEFLRGIGNPVGIKCGPGITAESLLRLLDGLDPHRRPGRATLIVRLGADRAAEALPPLIRAVRQEGHPVLWVCDPMHGNTRRTADGLKTRSLEHIASELASFFAACRSEGAHGGGLHLEMTARHVTECTGAPGPLGDDQLARGYETLCDPRLNPAQAMTIAKAAAAELRRGRSPLAA